jgi:cytochrome c oxidase cbb3-type subunit 3
MGATADMPTEFWGGWIVLVTVVSFVALVWLVFDVYFAKGARDGIDDQVWDETLREGMTPPPMWWFWLILALMTFSVLYLILYPGLGKYRGTLQWSQGHEIAHSLANYELEFGPERERILSASLESLGTDAGVMRSAARIFNNHCSACHGIDAAGQAALFPDLTDEYWQWGNGGAQLEQTIRSGRTAVMPPWQAVLGDDGVARLADYVLALSTGSGDTAESAETATTYQQFCSACHGASGAGNPALGAPALDDQAWLYGGTRQSIARSIAEGRSGVMPAFAGRLDDVQVRMLLAWLNSGAVATEFRLH